MCSFLRTKYYTIKKSYYNHKKQHKHDLASSAECSLSTTTPPSFCTFGICYHGLRFFLDKRNTQIPMMSQISGAFYLFYNLASSHPVYNFIVIFLTDDKNCHN